MQVSQGLFVIEPGAFRHKTFDELQHTARAIGKSAQDLARIAIDSAVAPLVEQPFGFRCPFGRRQVEERQKIARLVVGAGLLELRLSFGIDQRRCRIRKRIGRIATCGVPLSLDKDRPTGFQAPQCVVKATSDGNEFGRPSPKFCRPLERPILVQDDPLIDKSRPR